MTIERLNELLRVTGHLIPEGMEEHIADLEPGETELLPRETLVSVLEANGVTGEKRQKLLDALDTANAVPELTELAHIMAQDAVRGLVRCHAVEFFQPRPECLDGFAKEAFAFLFTQLCVLEGWKALRARGVPESYDADIPERMTRKQLKKYMETGDISFDDYPWDMNFYCCQIFFLSRFYFIPYRWGDAPVAWRNRETGKVTALWRGGDRIRRDGQLDGGPGQRLRGAAGGTDPADHGDAGQKDLGEGAGRGRLPAGAAHPGRRGLHAGKGEGKLRTGAGLLGKVLSRVRL